ncbi:pimelyl-ACP methyl ester esterase BioV [Hydrogenimonas thermophila]|uniref:Alpha/beta hydrolase fold n=1 Tax=Hydrogenimonas thermophila TaxID=223786 RepID=A0A1I5N9M2_9BACT|nr:pimelyl-ACP methyl ester esterase BioV [Hydrogenimonas thermophila]SFP18489.1 alpha/beta hydrolase fold [Hydrogenimonas thermophila]
MIFFSGFSLKNEEELFYDYLNNVKENPYVVVGFSYGAIKALEFTANSNERIDKLILISPAWFCNKSKAFIKTQLLYYKKDADAYTKTFLKNIAYPANLDLSKYIAPATLFDLEKLLTYQWPSEPFKICKNRDIIIETYLGGKDKIIDAYEAHEFFRQYSESYFFKNVGHILMSL